MEHSDPGFKLHSPVLTRPAGRPRKNKIRLGEEGRVPKQRKCRKCGILGHIARLCTNPVEASFGEEERWTAANAEDNSSAMDNEEEAEENAAANACSRKRLREEETSVEPSLDAEFEAMEVIVPVIPFKMIEPTEDRQLVIKCSEQDDAPPPPPQPQVKTKRNKTILKPQNITPRQTRSKTVKPSAHTRSRSKI